MVVCVCMCDREIDEIAAKERKKKKKIDQV